MTATSGVSLSSAPAEREFAPAGHGRAGRAVLAARRARRHRRGRGRRGRGARAGRRRGRPRPRGGARPRVARQPPERMSQMRTVPPPSPSRSSAPSARVPVATTLVVCPSNVAIGFAFAALASARSAGCGLPAAASNACRARWRACSPARSGCRSVRVHTRVDASQNRILWSYPAVASTTAGPSDGQVRTTKSGRPVAGDGWRRCRPWRARAPALLLWISTAEAGIPLDPGLVIADTRARRSSSPWHSAQAFATLSAPAVRARRAASFWSMSGGAPAPPRRTRTRASARSGAARA